MGAWALAIGGYIAASATNPSPIQPDSAIIAIKATIGLLPALAALIVAASYADFRAALSLGRRVQTTRDSEMQGRVAACIRSLDQDRKARFGNWQPTDQQARPN